MSNFSLYSEGTRLRDACRSKADARQLAYRLRYQRGWPVRRIALKLGVTPWAVYKLLSRKRPSRVLKRQTPPPKSRTIRAASLSGAFNV